MGIDRIRDIIVRDNVKPSQFPHSREMLACVPHITHHGFDDVGNIISYQITGLIDPAAVVNIPEEHFREWFFYEIECVACMLAMFQVSLTHLRCPRYKSITLSRLSREHNRLARIRTVRDMTGLGMHHLHTRAIKLFKSVIIATQRAYPEFLASVLIINAPWVFSTAFKLVRSRSISWCVCCCCCCCCC